MNKNKRNINIDILKTLAIILVIIGHLIQVIYSPNNFDNNIIFKIIYSFHMALFMFISGYLTKSKKIYDLKWIFKRFCRLIIPFLIWSIFDYFIFKQYLEMTIVQKMISLLIHPDTGLWFLPVLFYNCCLLFISYYLSKFINKRQSIVYLIILIAIQIPLSFLGIGILKTHVINFSFGYFYCNLEKNINKIKLNKKLIITICMIVLIILEIFWKRVDLPIFCIYLEKINFPIIIINCINSIYKSVVAILAIIILFNITNIINVKNKIVFYISYIGKYTLEIYIIHFYLIKILNNYSIFKNILFFPLLIIICIYIPIIISKILDNIKPINKILFGKN